MATIGHILTSGNRRLNINEQTDVSLNPYIATWKNKLILDGVVEPSKNTQLATSAFIDELQNANILQKFICINCFVPDSLSASLSPQYHTQGYRTFQRVNFVDSDLSVNGLAGNGTTKFLDTGINVSSSFWGHTRDIGVSFFNTNTSFVCGGSPSSANDFLVSPNVFDCYDNSTSRVTASLGILWGFNSGNRYNTTSSIRYYASIVSGSTIIENGFNAGNSAASAPPTQNITLFAHNRAGTMEFYTVGPCSFWSIHFALTKQELQKLYDAVIRLRKKLGGGYV